MQHPLNDTLVHSLTCRCIVSIYSIVMLSNNSLTHTKIDAVMQIIIRHSSGSCVVLPLYPLICVPVSPSSVSGRLLDATKNYMYVFLLAGSEVVLSAVVLAACNFLFIREQSPTPADALEKITVADDAKTEACGEPTEMKDEEEKGAREEQEKETIKEVIKEPKEAADIEKVEVRPESVTVDSQEVERFLKEPQENGDMATSPETCL